MTDTCPKTAVMMLVEIALICLILIFGGCAALAVFFRPALALISLAVAVALYFVAFHLLPKHVIRIIN